VTCRASGYDAVPVLKTDSLQGDSESVSGGDKGDKGDQGDTGLTGAAGPVGNATTYTVRTGKRHGLYSG
jgi:hypothetical protein